MFKKFVVKPDTNTKTSEYKPKEFSLRVTQEAQNFERSQLSGAGTFVIDQSSADRSGLSYLKQKRIQSEISEKVELKLVKEKESIFEEYKSKGFAEGLKLGKSEGKKEQLAAFKEVIEHSLLQLKKATDEITFFKDNLVNQTESQILELLKLAIHKICLKEMTQDDLLIKNMIQKSLEENSKEEKLQITLSPEDHQKLNLFLNELKEKSLPRQITFKKDESIEPSGLLVESSRGQTDKTIATRFENVWEAFTNNEKP